MSLILHGLRIHRAGHAAAFEQLALSLLVYATVVSTFVLAASFATWLNSGLPALVVYAGIAWALLWARRWKSAPRLDAGKLASAGGGLLVAALLGMAAGCASYPAWVGLIGWVGLGLGLELPDFSSRWDGSAAIWAAGIVLAPVWEELLYRERMLLAFRQAWGVAPAVVLSSAAFALPHLYGGSWALLGTFLVGMALAGVALVGRSVWLCVGIHAGLNLGALAWQHGPGWLVLGPGASAAVGWLGLGAALALLRRGRARRGAADSAASLARSRVEVA